MLQLCELLEMGRVEDLPLAYMLPRLFWLVGVSIQTSVLACLWDPDRISSQLQPLSTPLYKFPTLSSVLFSSLFPSPTPFPLLPLLSPGPSLPPLCYFLCPCSVSSLLFAFFSLMWAPLHGVTSLCGTYYNSGHPGNAIWTWGYLKQWSGETTFGGEDLFDRRKWGTSEGRL